MDQEYQQYLTAVRQNQGSIVFLHLKHSNNGNGLFRTYERDAQWVGDYCRLPVVRIMRRWTLDVSRDEVKAIITHLSLKPYPREVVIVESEAVQ